MKAIHSSWAWVAAVLIGTAALCPSNVAWATGSSEPPAFGQDSSAAENPAMSKLKGSQFKDVKATVDNDGIATLTGSVSLYEYKADAQRKVLHAKGVKAVRNEIQVAGTEISDAALRSKLQQALQYDRVGYGHVFDAIGVQVQDGAVTLSGHAHDYPDRDSAVAVASMTPGVKDVVDEIQVDPTSILDDQTRLAVARAIYGYPTLNKYAIDPAKPIRISVQNGNVELYGTVDSQADKDTANLRANAVPGVFSVKNYLQVAGSASESQKQ